MEKNLLRLLKIADQLNEKQDKVYAMIIYSADDSKNLEICIRKKKDFTYVEKCEIQLNNNVTKKIKNIIELLESYVGGVSDE